MAKSSVPVCALDVAPTGIFSFQICNNWYCISWRGWLLPEQSEINNWKENLARKSDKFIKYYDQQNLFCNKLNSKELEHKIPQ